MIRLIPLAAWLLSGLSAYGQTVYVDVLTAPAMVVYAEVLKAQQEKTNDNLSAINRAQLLVQAQLQRANDLHQTVLRGLQEVSGTVRNAIAVRHIYQTSADIVQELGEVVQLASDHPVYAVFAARALGTFRQRAVELAADVTRVLTGGEVNMLDAGERQRMLQGILRDLKLLYGAAFSMHYTMRYAIRNGFWRSINPFATYVNQDARIMRGILRDASRI